MARHCTWVLACLLALGCSPQPADLVIVGNVYTMDPTSPRAEAVAVQGDRIVFVGGSKEALQWVGADTRVIELPGHSIVPGLIDAHGHLMNLGTQLATLDVNGTPSPAAVREMVLQWQETIAPGEWIIGRGWDQNDWDVKQFPTASDLSGTLENPVYLRRVGGHAVWVNETALEIAGVDRNTVDPPGGRIIRDAGGDPTGILIDDAMDLVRKHIPQTSEAETERRIRMATSVCIRFGLTGVHDAHTAEPELRAYERLDAQGELPLRIYCMLDSKYPDFVRARVAQGPAQSGRLTVRCIKAYADGALGSRGALLLRPYEDDPDNQGIAIDPSEELEEWTELALENGFQLGVHAIGDGGNRRVLDAYEKVLARHAMADHRLRVEHGQVLALDDIPRFSELGVIASMQPRHCTSDMYWAEDRVGGDRILGAYAWRRLLDSGARLALGSDFPVESANPLWGVYAAVTRQDHDGWPAGGWYPAERLSLEEALHGFTLGAAYAEFGENSKGSLQVGKLADITVLNGELSADAPRSILETEAVMTVVGGEIVYERAPLVGVER